MLCESILCQLILCIVTGSDQLADSSTQTGKS